MTEQNIFEEQTNTVIIGKKGSAKTTLGWSLAKKNADVSKRKICIYNHPRPELLNNLDFEVTNISRMDQLATLTDAVVICDEAHELFPVIDKKINEELRILLSRSRQNNTCFIFICHNSYFINRGLFNFIDVKIIKEVNNKHWELERPFMNKLYRQVHVFGKENFFIDSDLVRGNKTFEKPTWWKEELSTAYRCHKVEEDFFA